MIRAPRNALVSYHHLKNETLDEFDQLRFIGDSGAYSALSTGATIDNAELAEWGHRWRHRLAWVAALDVIGDAAATRRNWTDIVEQHHLDAIPTMHFGEPAAVMDYYAERGVDFMGLGGLAGLRSPPKAMRWLVGVFRHAQRNHPQMRFHGWGVTANDLLRLPWFSVDSSSWSSGFRYGRLTLRDPRTNRAVTIALDGQEAYRPEYARLLALHYGVAPSTIALSVGANQHVTTRIAGLATSVQEEHLRRLHGPISAPQWGMGGDQTPGPHLHLALVNTKQVGIFNDLAADESRPPPRPDMVY